MQHLLNARTTRLSATEMEDGGYVNAMGEFISTNEQDFDTDGGLPFSIEGTAGFGEVFFTTSYGGSLNGNQIASEFASNDNQW
jgi:hypothetical protein